MNKKEFLTFLEKNERAVTKAMKEFDEHSRKFDERMKKILSVL